MKKTLLFIFIFFISFTVFSQQVPEHTINCVNPTGSNANEFTIYQTQNASLSVGDIVVTKGFYLKNDEGGARYRIILKSSVNPVEIDHYSTIFSAGSTMYNNSNQEILAILLPNRDGSINLKQSGIGSSKSRGGKSISQLNTLALKEALHISKHILIPSGNYLFNDGVKIPSGSIIEGIGNTVSPSVIRVLLNFHQVKNITISNITFAGYNPGQFSNSLIFHDGGNDNIILRNCSFLDNTRISQAESLTRNGRFIISGCKFLSNNLSSQHSLVQLNADNVIIENNIFDLSGAREAIKFYDDAKNITVKNNAFKGFADEEMIDTYEVSDNLYLINNTFDIDKGRCFLSKPHGTGCTDCPIRSTHIINNKIYSKGLSTNGIDSDNNNLILCAGRYNLTPNSVRDETIIVSGNIIHSEDLQTAIKIVGKERTIITNNIITGINIPEIIPNTTIPKSSNSIVVGAIKYLTLSHNNIKGRIYGDSPNSFGELHSSYISQGIWNIHNNILTDCIGKNAMLWIRKICGLNLMIHENTFIQNSPSIINYTIKLDDPKDSNGNICNLNDIMIYNNEARLYPYSNSLAFTLQVNKTSVDIANVYREYDNSWNPEENITPFISSAGHPNPSGTNTHPDYLGQEYFDTMNHTFYKAIKMYDSANPNQLLWSQL